MQLLSIWCCCRCLITFKTKWGDWLDTMSKTARGLTLHWTYFQQECSQQFSPVADWMSSVDLFLEDEGQQYGNMEEAASVARTPATCLEVWFGDHRQTPGGLKKSKEIEIISKETHQAPAGSALPNSVYSSA